MNLKSFVCLSLLALAVSFSSTVHAQTFSVIHNFTGGADGALPVAGVTIKGSALYGTAGYGGGNKWGVVYQAKNLGNNNWSVVPLSYLPIRGYQPDSKALFGPDGHLYSTARYGQGSFGSVYSLAPPASPCKTASCPWAQSELHAFTGSPDGNEPGFGDLAWDQQGNIYGTTYWGGQNDVGVVYEIMPTQNGWTEVPIYSFLDRPDGAYPDGGLLVDGNGNLFGTTAWGGANNAGTVFELTYQVGVGWKETILYSFVQPGNDGRNPHSGLIFDKSGNLYGTTMSGGPSLAGTVFELSPSGNSWTYQQLYSFTGRGGCGPVTPPTLDSAGNLYGTTTCGGANMFGNVFQLATTANGWVYHSLYDFTGGNDGAQPNGSVTIDTDGTLYGTATIGGTHGQGTLWMIKP